MPHRRLTVLHILPALESGGTELCVLDIAAALVKAGHRSIVISAGGRLVSRLTSCGAEHVTKTLGTKSPLTLRHVPWLRRFLTEQRVDVVDYQSRMPGWLTYLAWKSMPSSHRPALISTVNGLHSTGLYSSIMCRGQDVVVVSNAVRDYVRTHYPFVNDSQLHVIHRGIDTQQFPRGFQPTGEWNSQFFQQFPQAANRPLLTLAGRLTRLKGHIDFLRLLAELREHGMNVHGLIVGDVDRHRAGYANELKNMVTQLQLEERVTFTGHRTDLREIYAVSSAVFSLSSKPEAFGLTVAESLSIGTPVIGYNHGGVAEILATQFPEGAVEPGDQHMLMQTALRILRSEVPPVPRPNQFERSTMLSRTLELYTNVAQKTRHA
jgi:glycosyltransferase involved in cell wall biosynthesis